MIDDNKSKPAPVRISPPQHDTSHIRTSSASLRQACAAQPIERERQCLFSVHRTGEASLVAFAISDDVLMMSLG